MPRGVRVSMFDQTSRTWVDRTFSAEFPIRIGRSSLNDLPLASSGVSQFHAVLEVVEGRATIRDLGSKNGTLVAGAPVPPNTTHYLAPGCEVIIVDFLLTITLIDLADEPKLMGTPGSGVAPIPEALLGSTAGGEGLLRAETLRIQEGNTDPLVREGITPAWMKHRFEPQYKDFLVARSRMLQTIHAMLEGADEETKRDGCQRLMREFPELGLDMDFRNMAEPAPASQGSLSVHNASSSFVAARAIGSLASHFFPKGSLPQSAAEIATFMQHVKETLDVFFKCFIPLRDGYRAFTTELEIPSHNHTSTLESAASPQELAALLLDWRQQNAGPVEPKQAIEWVFADLMIHHMAMITGVMQGVKSLLAELSPAAIERALDDPRRSSAGLQIGPFRYKQLWELFATRHADLSEEDKETFAVIFGRDFAQAYAGLTADTEAVRGSGESPHVR